MPHVVDYPLRPVTSWHPRPPLTDIGLEGTSFYGNFLNYTQAHETLRRQNLRTSFSRKMNENSRKSAGLSTIGEAFPNAAGGAMPGFQMTSSDWARDSRGSGMWSQFSKRSMEDSNFEHSVGRNSRGFIAAAAPEQPTIVSSAEGAEGVVKSQLGKSQSLPALPPRKRTCRGGRVEPREVPKSVKPDLKFARKGLWRTTELIVDSPA